MNGSTRAVSQACKKNQLEIVMRDQAGERLRIHGIRVATPQDQVDLCLPVNELAVPDEMDNLWSKIVDGLAQVRTQHLPFVIRSHLASLDEFLEFDFWSALPATPGLNRLLIFKDLARSEQRRRRWTTPALALILALKAVGRILLQAPTA